MTQIPAAIDPRGPRFGAAVTTVLLVLVILFASTPLLALTVLIFAVNALVGPARSPYGVIFKRFVRPRLGPPAELEDPRPPRFAQTVGLVVTGLGLLAALLGGGAVAVVVSAGLAFVAAFLNAAFGLCLGCELYLLLVRLRPAATA